MRRLTQIISPMAKSRAIHVRHTLCRSVPCHVERSSSPTDTSEFTIDQKSRQAGYEAFPFPYFPPSLAFLAQGLNAKPGFFGSACTDVTPATPLVVYIPNYSITFATNTSTFTPSYSVDDQISFFNNGFAVATQNESLAWSECLACALIDAQVARNGGSRSAQCGQCFDDYCYMGTSDDSS